MPRAQTVAGWATAISAGPANEAGQSLSFNVGNNNTGAVLGAARDRLERDADVHAGRRRVRASPP